MKKYMVLLLLALSSMHCSVVSRGRKLRQLPPAADTIRNYKELTDRVVHPLEKMVFDDNCTEEEAVSFVKNQRKNIPHLFKAHAVHLMPCVKGVTDYSLVIHGTLVDAFLVEKEILETWQNCTKELGDIDTARLLNLEVFRRKALIHILRKSGVQRTWSEKALKELADTL